MFTELISDELSEIADYTLKFSSIMISRHYFAFDGENGVFYAPYADGDRVQGYVFEAGKLIKK